MKLEYYGHSFWRIVTDSISIVIDPFDNIGYPIPQHLKADYVFVSHEHHDHNNVSIIKGNPRIIRDSGLYELPDMKAEFISVFHDNENGVRRGKNNIIMLILDGLKIIHCGDLGHLPSSNVLTKIDNPDLLLVPVGEVYTIALKEIWQMIKSIKPRLIFPMHFKTTALGFQLGELAAFTQSSVNVFNHGKNTIEITQELLSSEKTVILNWANKE